MACQHREWFYVKWESHWKGVWSTEGPREVTRCGKEVDYPDSV